MGYRPPPPVQVEFENFKNSLIQDGIEKGIEKGIERGARSAAREGVQALCEVLGIGLDGARQRQLDALDAAGLRALTAQIKLQRRWPE